MSAKDPVVGALDTTMDVIAKLEGVAHPDVLADLKLVRHTLANVHAYGWPKPEDR